MTDQESLPPTITATMINRALFDFMFMREPDQLGPEFHSEKFIEGLIDQIRSLRREYSIYFIVSFLLAMSVFAGGIPTDAVVEAFGFSAPLGLLSRQALSVVMAGFYTATVTTFISNMLAQNTLRILLEDPRYDSWEFRVAHRDAKLLWVSLIRPKVVGYRTSRLERTAVAVLLLTSFASLIAHSAVIVVAEGAALTAAIKNGDVLSMALSLLATSTVLVTFAAMIFATIIPMTYHHPGTEKGKP